MKISLRILFGYFAIVGLAGWFVLTTFRDEVKPGVRQAMEATLVDTAHVLAGVAADDLDAGEIAQGRLASSMKSAASHPLKARIWDFDKTTIDLRVTVTNVTGKVLYDSTGQETGQDHSRWLDVALTLQGKYGARSTRSDSADPNSSVMHVAAPIRKNGRVLGVITVSKPNKTVQPFVDRSRRRILKAGMWLLGSSLLIGLLFAAWITRSLAQLRGFAEAVSRGENVTPPDLSGTELAVLSTALATMRDKLEGKKYVEQYVHSLTHEMKSPLTAIRAAAELLHEDVPAAQRTRFVANIESESLRLQTLVDRMLALAAVESRQRLQTATSEPIGALVQAVVSSRSEQAKAKGVTIDLDVRLSTGPSSHISCDRLLLEQAVGNLLDNALDFSVDGQSVTVTIEAAVDGVCVSVTDEGPGIPDFAAPRVFERFFSLPRPGTDLKSTGLGLPFVREVAGLHNGRVTLRPNEPSGVRAELLLPTSAPKTP